MQYLFAYSGDIEIIYCLKNGLVEPIDYAEQVLTGTVGLEGLYYLLLRLKTAFLLLEIMWNFVRKPGQTDGLFIYLAELVLGQLAEEFSFVREVGHNLIKNRPGLAARRSDQAWWLQFLQLYERLVWNSKKIQEVGGTYRGVIEASGLKVPQLFRISDEDSRMINESLIEFESELSKFKLQTEKMSLQLKKTKSIGAFAKLCDIQGKFANNVLLFSQKNILNKLEQEVVQKRSSKEEVEVITEGDENSYS